MCRAVRGFSIIEAIIASAILVAAAGSFAQLWILSSRALAVAGARTDATLLAVDKLEELRSLTWTVDAVGLPVSAPGLAASPADALDRDEDGFADHPGAYTRRWWIRPLAADSANTLVLQVRVIAANGADARLTTVRTRRADARVPE